MTDTNLLLGEIRGELKQINKRMDQIDTIDERLRAVEQRSIRNGVVAAAVGTVGFNLVIASIKSGIDKISGT